MPECSYCAEVHGDEQELKYHLYRDHSREQLSRDDKTRVERSFESFIQHDITIVERHLQRKPTHNSTVAAIDTFERVLRKTLEWQGLDQVHDRYREGEMILVDALDAVVQTSGREILLDLIYQYDPRAEIAVPPGIGVIIGNTVGRDIIRTRSDQGVEEIPAAELGYLETLAEYEHPVESPDDHRFTDERWAVSSAYGWGIGHPLHDVAGYIIETARNTSTVRWSEQTLIQAFYADPDAATDTLERFLTDDQTRKKRLVLQSIKFVTWGLGIPTPGWDWRAELDVNVELEDEVVERLRGLVEENNFSDEVSEDWPYTAEKEEHT